jgi:hypothetical protein
MRKRQLFVALASLSLIFALAPAPLASAATANGKCGKSGATAKIGGKNYICSKNPTVKKAKLTWVLKDCISANRAHLGALKSFNETESSTQKALDTLDAAIKSLELQIPIDKERAAKELQSAVTNRATGEARKKQAAGFFEQAKAVGVLAVTTAWTIQANAAARDGVYTPAEKALLAQQWGLTPAQTDGVLIFVSAQTIDQRGDAFLAAAVKNEKNAAAYAKTESTKDNLISQRIATLETQKALISISKGDVDTTRTVRNSACRVKR